MSQIRASTIAELAPGIRTGDISPVNLVRTCLEKIEAGRDGNAFIAVCGDDAIRAAEQAESEIKLAYRGPLHGIPIAVKDLVDVAGMPTTSGSAVPARMATHDAPIVRRLREAGAVIIGKTNLHEFAFGTTSEESAFGPSAIRAIRYESRADRAAARAQRLRWGCVTALSAPTPAARSESPPRPAASSA